MERFWRISLYKLFSTTNAGVVPVIFPRLQEHLLVETLIARQLFLLINHRVTAQSKLEEQKEAYRGQRSGAWRGSRRC